MPTYIRVKDLANAATTPATDDFILLSGAANGARKISRADFLTAVAGFYTADPSTYKLATLDAGDKVLVSQLPSSAFSYQGTWAASTNTPTLANGTGTAGDTYYASDSGSVDFGAGSISFLAGDAVVYDGSIWQKVPDVVNLLDGKGTLDEAKTTLEIPDVGTAPDETPLNQHLGSLAYQSADSVSMASAEVETLEVTDKIGVGVTPSHPLEVSGNSYLIGASSSVIGNNDATNYSIGDSSGVLQNKWYGGHEWYTLGSNQRMKLTSDGKVGIGGSPSYELDVTAANARIAATSSTGVVNHLQADSTGAWVGPLSNHNLYFKQNNTTRWTINTSGNLVPSSGLGIDFSSTSDGSGSGQAEILDDFETGEWDPQYYSSGGTLTATMDVRSARYVKVGHVVTVMCYIRTSNVNTSSASGSLRISGLPYAVAGSDNYTGVYIGHAIGWATAPAGGYTDSGSSNIVINKRASIGGNLDPLAVSGLTNGSGTYNEIMLTATYCSF